MVQLSLHLHETMEVLLLPLVVSVHTSSVVSQIIDRCDMSYRMSEREYVSLAIHTSVKSLLQFGIRLGALGTHDTKLLHVVEVEPEQFPLTIFVNHSLSVTLFHAAAVRSCHVPP